MRLIRFRFALPVIAVFSLLSTVEAALSPDAILLKSDEVRNPQMDYTMSVKITSVKPGRANASSTYEVLVKGRDRTVVKTLTPAVDSGRVLLMNGTNLWGYLPNVSKPLRISLQERLMGEVANGDLARANFSGDYTVKLSGTKLVNKKKYYVLDLKAKSPEITYDRVVLWVDAVNFHPLKAEFFAVSGRLLKTCAYENFGDLGGRVRPRRQVMTDPLNKGQYSILDYTNTQVTPLADKLFTKDYMKRLSD